MLVFAGKLYIFIYQSHILCLFSLSLSLHLCLSVCSLCLSCIDTHLQTLAFTPCKKKKGGGRGGDNVLTYFIF